MHKNEKVKGIAGTYYYSSPELLKDKLNLYIQGNKEDFVCQAQAEVSRLSSAGNMAFMLFAFHFCSTSCLDKS